MQVALVQMAVPEAVLAQMRRRAQEEAAQGMAAAAAMASRTARRQGLCMAICTTHQPWAAAADKADGAITTTTTWSCEQVGLEAAL